MCEQCILRLQLRMLVGAPQANLFGVCQLNAIVEQGTLPSMGMSAKSTL
jgi:hypothetical protein